MREFFKGWRRKAGCGLLVVAMMMLVAWTRSQFVTDTRCLLEDHSGSYHLIAESKSGCLSLLEMRVIWNVDGSTDVTRNGIVTINYLMAIAPLTLFSAYLILWKPRPKDRPNA